MLLAWLKIATHIHLSFIWLKELVILVLKSERKPSFWNLVGRPKGNHPCESERRSTDLYDIRSAVLRRYVPSPRGPSSHGSVAQLRFQRWIGVAVVPSSDGSVGQVTSRSDPSACHAWIRWSGRRQDVWQMRRLCVQTLMLQRCV